MNLYEGSLSLILYSPDRAQHISGVCPESNRRKGSSLSPHRWRFLKAKRHCESLIRWQALSENTLHPVVGKSGTELNINETVPLDYDEFLESIAIWGQIRPTLLFETSRGCWWGERAHCTFCGLNGLTMKYRSKSADVAMSQFGSLFRYAGRLPYLRLQCVDNIMPREYVKEVLPYLDVPENVGTLLRGEGRPKQE